MESRPNLFIDCKAFPGVTSQEVGNFLRVECDLDCNPYWWNTCVGKPLYKRFGFVTCDNATAAKIFALRHQLNFKGYPVFVKRAHPRPAVTPPGLTVPAAARPAKPKENDQP